VDNFVDNLRDLKKLGVKVIDFTGGEPLLHREIDVMLQKAKDAGFITTITTNTLLYPKWAERLRGKVDMLHFSLDSPIREEHDTSRNIKCFDFLQESIKIAQTLGERPDILFTVFEHNIHQIQQVWEDYCQKLGLVLILNPVFDYGDVGSTLSVDALKMLSDWGKKKNVYLNDAFVSLRLDGGNHIKNPVCKAASTTIVISPENKLVLPCYHLGLEHFPINGNLAELYNSEKVQQVVQQEGKLAECEGCVINCYMQPSFAVEINKYWWQALPSTIKYNYLKGTWKGIF
jgi:MoaA/NifB/PqqE/SkfB family radical SAM enzyme